MKDFSATSLVAPIPRLSASGVDGTEAERLVTLKTLVCPDISSSEWGRQEEVCPHFAAECRRCVSKSPLGGNVPENLDHISQGVVRVDFITLWEQVASPY